MSLQKHTVYIVIICFLVAITARCFASNFSANPSQTLQHTRHLYRDQDNIITKDAIIQPFHEYQEAPVVFLITSASKPPTTPNPQLTAIVLANHNNLLELLQQQKYEAQIDLEERQKQLALAEKASLNAHLVAEEALEQLSSLTAALHESLKVFQASDESSRISVAKFEKQKVHTEKAQAFLQATEQQLQETVTDYEATKKAAEIAAKSAQEAQTIAYGIHADSSIY